MPGTIRTASDVILTASHGDADRLGALAAGLGPGQPRSSADPALAARTYGGDADMPASVTLGAVSGLNLSALILALRAIAWERPDAVQLFVRRPGTARFMPIDWRRYPTELLGS